MHDISLTKTFDTGHRIVGHKGKCARLHGHTYKAEIKMRAEKLVHPGFVSDFGDIKEIIDQWDHRLLLWDQDPFLDLITAEDYVLYGMFQVPFNPTAENMAKALAVNLYETLHPLDVWVTLWETPNASATVYWTNDQ